MKPALGLVFFVLTPVFAQYGGPAILSRGQAPAAMVNTNNAFRPYLSVQGIYDTGLAGASVTETGQIANESSSGMSLRWGVNGNHSWRHTSVGLAYDGVFTYYNRKTFFTGINQAFLLGVAHQFSRHLLLTVRETAGVYSRSFVHTGLQPTVPFDPVATYIPATDYFDNRTYYGSSQIDLTLQKTSRLSFNMGGDFFITRRRSRALYGMTGIAARGDLQYRWTRRTTIGASYTFTHFRYTRIFGGTHVHGVAGTFAAALSARLEFSGFAGVNRAESKFLEVVAVDPVITALLGITSGTRVSHTIVYGPLLGGRLSRTFARGVAYVNGGRTFTPGNGLFLTSLMTTGAAGYNYTGIRRWALGVRVSYSRGGAYGPFPAKYSTGGGELNASRTLTRGLHMLTSYSARKYFSPSYSNYDRLIHEASVGLAFSPGDVPLHFW